ncbi:MAG: glycosyltransferase family 2 protein [Firmicutes bacterium]|nr:glycosyltransferase family 2 protein [Bacillota bacterium]
MEEVSFVLLSIIVSLAQLIITFVTIYYYAVSVFGWKKNEETHNFPPTKRFALITPAHNEELVIKYHIESLKKLNYPSELYDIYIIADNCTDNTAEVARAEGVTVMERFSPQRGKGFALEWMFNELFKMEDKHYDAVCVFDADNVVSSNFLTEMNARLLQGYKSIQGYLDTKNPNDSWVTACYATAYWSMNRMWQLARYNLGLSNALGGTGLCIDIEVLKQYGWGAHCLTEDLEFTMKLLLNDIKTSWCHEAKVYDEKPVYFSQTWKQRTRWLQGHWDVALRYMIPLLKKGFAERKWYCIDGAIYLFQPMWIMTVLFTFLISFIAAFFPQPIYTTIFSHLLPGWLWTILGILGYLYPMAGLYLENAPKKAYFYYITYPLYGLTWFPVTIVGLLKHHEKDWAHTRHTRGISINSLENS